MKKLFTILFSFMMIFILKAQDKQAPVEILYPEDAFKYDQVLPPYQTPDHHPDCENYILDVMFKDEAIVRLRNGELTDLRTDATVGIKSILDELTWFEWERFS